MKKRDEKLKDKREIAIEKAIREQEREGKDARKSDKAGDAVAGSLKQVKYDDDLQSDSDEEADDDSDDGDMEEGEYDDEEGEEGEESD